MAWVVSMIVSASRRTDIPAFYGRWFRHRLREGFCRTYNPYTRVPMTVPLTPEQVDGLVFWTRHVTPFLPVLDVVQDLGLPFYVQHTLTAYPRALETRTPAISRSVAGMEALAARFGPAALVWRYDPIVVTSVTPLSWHRQQFATLARTLRGLTDEVVVSWVDMYAKTRRRLAAQAKAVHFEVTATETADRRIFTEELATIAADCGITLTLCAEPSLDDVPGTRPARCVDLDRLGRTGSRLPSSPARSNRSGCLCAPAVDIGVYDTCPHGCVYCYAVATDHRARAAFRRHDPNAPALVPDL